MNTREACYLISHSISFKPTSVGSDNIPEGRVLSQNEHRARTIPCTETRKDATLCTHRFQSQLRMQSSQTLQQTGCRPTDSIYHRMLMISSLLDPHHRRPLRPRPHHCHRLHQRHHHHQQLSPLPLPLPSPFVSCLLRPSVLRHK
jgi:hypothetical protein